MDNFRLDHVEAAQDNVTVTVLRPLEKSRSWVLMGSIFLIGMSAGNMHHPYDGLVAMLIGSLGLFAYGLTMLITTYYRQLQKIKANVQAEASLHIRLQKHVLQAHFNTRSLGQDRRVRTYARYSPDYQPISTQYR
jgi:hypothetical protein